MKTAKPKPTPTRVRGGRKPSPKQANDPSSAQFEREGMGVAPKE